VGINHLTSGKLPAPAFDHQPRTRLIFDAGALARLGALARELGARRVLIVTDPGIVRAGHVARAERSLSDAGLAVAVFDAVRENPTTLDVARCVQAARAQQTDLLVGLGGGSSMDTAKGCNFVLTNGGEMRDYWGVGKAARPMLPLIAVPTTAGTGSECQCAALIADEVTHQKMACLDPKAAARVALLDPELTLSQPPAVTAHTGVDALAHAVETAVTRRRNPISLMHSHEAFKRLIPAFPRVLAAPDDLAARAQMLLASSLAGLAIENSMLGAAHACANPLTAQFGVVHGEAVGLMLPHVVRFNAADPAARLAYAELASAPEIACVSDGLEPAVGALVTALEALLNRAGIARSLADLGVSRAAIPELAAGAARQWTAQFNPRPVAEPAFQALYEAAFAPRPDRGPDALPA
jgi:alcohol dehydrogenase